MHRFARGATDLSVALGDFADSCDLRAEPSLLCCQVHPIALARLRLSLAIDAVLG